MNTTIPNAVKNLLRSLKIESRIQPQSEPLILGKDGFDRMISIDPQRKDWESAVRFFLRDLENREIEFAWQILPDIHDAEHLKDSTNTVLLRYVKDRDIDDDLVIERYDGLFRCL